MSFGLLKHFKDSKKGFQAQSEGTFIENIIFGYDLASILKLIELRRTTSSRAIKLITPRLVNKQTLIENYQLGITQIRSEEAVTEIYKNHMNAKISPHKHGPQFYKDGKFHDFGSRAKSMELLEGEHFFLNKGYRLNIQSLFTEDDWNNLDSIISEHIDIRIVDTIEKSQANDLVEKAEWALTFKDFKKLSCENLYVSLSPKKFLAHLKNKETMSSELIDLCSSAHIQSALSITWVMNKEYAQDDRTLFIPQSMTHEWGHFIVEFERDENEHLCHGLFLVHEQDVQAEDLATKIRLMKRVLDRIFPDFEQHIKNEYIRFDEEMFISGIKDNLIEQIAFDYPTLKFLGQTAPMKSEFSHEKFLARVLLS